MEVSKLYTVTIIGRTERMPTPLDPEKQIRLCILVQYISAAATCIFVLKRTCLCTPPSRLAPLTPAS